jgi:hypothetical protein
MHSAGNEGRPRRPPLLQGFPSPRSARMRRTRLSAPHSRKMRHRAREQAAPGPGEEPSSNREGPENNARASPAHPFRGGGSLRPCTSVRGHLGSKQPPAAPPAFAPLSPPPAMAFARGELDNTIDLRRTTTDGSVDIEDDAELDERDVAAEEFQEPVQDEEEPAEDPADEAFFDCKDEVPPPPAAADAPAAVAPEP